MTNEPDPVPFVELPRVKPPSLDGVASDPPEPWEPLAPAAAGFRSDVEDRLDAALAAGRAPDLHGLVVVRGGRLVLERYRTGEDFSWNWPHGVVAFGPATLHDLRSVTKSVVALLYGIALADGLVPGPDQPLLSGLPAYADLAADPDRARLTVGHALTMTLGLEWREEPPYDSPANGEIAMELAPDRCRYVLTRPVAAAPGRQWAYCGGASALLGQLIETGTGRSLPDFARDRLFAPLGVGRYEWLAGADGVAAAASGLRLAPRDLARVGQAVLAGGRAPRERGGRQVVPADWVRSALRPRVRTQWGVDYGYQWYLGGTGRRRWVGAMGNGGQRLLVYPELDLVVAVTAGGYDGDPQPSLNATVDDVVLASLLDG